MGKDLFAKLTQTADSEFSILKGELKKQENWINQLNGYAKELHRYSHYISESNTKHKTEILGQINSLSKWIEYLNTSNIELKREISDMKISFRKMLRNDFELYHRTLEEYLRLKFDDERQKKDTLKQEVLKELREELLSHAPKQAGPQAPSLDSQASQY